MAMAPMAGLARDAEAIEGGGEAAVGVFHRPARQATADEAAHFDAQLEAYGLDDQAGPTRHFVDDTPVTVERYGGSLNQHITPLDSRQAYVQASISRSDGSLGFAGGAFSVGRPDMAEDTAARAFQPDTGTVTPQGWHLTEAGEAQVLEHAYPDIQPDAGPVASETIAHDTRLPLTHIDLVLRQVARQRAAETAGTAPVRRAATPETLRPGADEPGQLTLRGLRNDAQEDGTSPEAKQHYKSLMSTGAGIRARMTRLGQRDIVDQSQDGKSARQIAPVVGLGHQAISVLLKPYNLGSKATQEHFTPDERDEVAMRYLFGNESQHQIARSGHRGQDVAQHTVARQVAAFNLKYPQGTPERAAKKAAHEQTRTARVMDAPTPFGFEAGPSAPGPSGPAYDSDEEMED